MTKSKSRMQKNTVNFNFTLPTDSLNVNLVLKLDLISQQMKQAFQCRELVLDGNTATSGPYICIVLSAR